MFTRNIRSIFLYSKLQQICMLYVLIIPSTCDEYLVTKAVANPSVIPIEIAPTHTQRNAAMPKANSWTPIDPTFKKL